MRVHPEIETHMKNINRLSPLRGTLSIKQVDLLRDEFLQALDFWEGSWSCSSKEMWKVLEASRYFHGNPEYGTADVDEACKLLIPLELVENSEKRLKTCWTGAAVEHREPHGVVSRTRFCLVPATIPQSPKNTKANPQPTAQSSEPAPMARVPPIQAAVDPSKSNPMVVAEPSRNPHDVLLDINLGSKPLPVVTCSRPLAVVLPSQCLQQQLW